MPNENIEVEDLSQAFSVLRENNTPVVDTPLEDGEGTETTSSEPQEPEGSVEQGSTETAGPTDDTLGDPGPTLDTDSGTTSTESTGIDYGSYEKNLMDNIDRQAIMRTQQMFQEKGWREISLDELVERDEHTGVVEFKNPDNPNRPFNRKEALEFVEAWNKDLNNQFKKQAKKMQLEMRKQYEPARKWIKFGPKYEKFDETKKEVFGSLVSQYAVRDSGGNVMGFNVDLDAASKQADTIINSLKARYANVPEVKKEEPTSPELDMGGSSSSSKRVSETPMSVDDITDINQAMLLYNKQQRNKSKKGSK